MAVVARAAWPQAAFDAKGVADAVKALGGAAPQENKGVTLTAPDIAENGAVVPVACACTLPDVKRLVLLVEKNPNTLAAVFEINEALEPSFAHAGEAGAVEQRLCGGADGRRHGVVRSKGSQGDFGRVRRVTLADRRLPQPAEPRPWMNDTGVERMSDPMRIRAQAQGDKALVRVLMSHEMETGLRKDSAGKTVPAWFIQEVERVAQRQAGVQRVVGHGDLEEPLCSVHHQGREGRRQDRGGLGGQPG